MNRIRVADVDHRVNSATVQRPLTEALGATDHALNYYELAPGDSFAYGYHRHGEQEEVFIILAGSVTFETESGEVVVGEGEAIRFAPEEFQVGTNRGEDRVIAYAIGAPRETGGTELFRDCESCGNRTPHVVEERDGGAEKVTRCRDCGSITGRFT